MLEVYLNELVAENSASVAEQRIKSQPNEPFLSQNYPNPFNPTTTIEYYIPHRGFVSLKIYSILGCEVATLVSRELEAGSYYAKFDASKFSSGIYFAKMFVNSSQNKTVAQVRKLILIK